MPLKRWLVRSPYRANENPPAMPEDNYICFLAGRCGHRPLQRLQNISSKIINLKHCKTYNNYVIILYVHGDVFGFDSNLEV